MNPTAVFAYLAIQKAGTPSMDDVSVFFSNLGLGFLLLIGLLFLGVFIESLDRKKDLK